MINTNVLKIAPTTESRQTSPQNISLSSTDQQVQEIQARQLSSGEQFLKKFTESYESQCSRLKELKPKPTQSIRSQEEFQQLTQMENEAFDVMLKNWKGLGQYVTLFDLLGAEIHLSFEKLLESMLEGPEKDHVRRCFTDCFKNYRMGYGTIYYFTNFSKASDEALFAGDPEQRSRSFPELKKLGKMSLEHIGKVEYTIQCLTSKLKAFRSRAQKVREINAHFAHLKMIWSIYAKLLTSDAFKILLNGWREYREIFILNNVSNQTHEVLMHYAKFLKMVLLQDDVSPKDESFLQLLDAIENTKKVDSMKGIETLQGQFFKTFEQASSGHKNHLRESQKWLISGKINQAQFAYMLCQLYLIKMYWAIDLHHTFYDGLAIFTFPGQFYPSRFYLSRINNVFTWINRTFINRLAVQPETKNVKWHPLVTEFSELIEEPLNRLLKDVLQKFEPNDWEALLNFIGCLKKDELNESWDRVHAFRNLVILSEHTDRITEITAGFKKIQEQILLWIETKAKRHPLSDVPRLKQLLVEELEEKGDPLICLTLLLNDVKSFTAGKPIADIETLLPDELFHALSLEGFEEAIEAAIKPSPQPATRSEEPASEHENLAAEALEDKTVNLQNEVKLPNSMVNAIATPTTIKMRQMPPLATSHQKEVQIPTKQEFLKMHKRNKILALLKKYGFEEKGGKGSHVFMVHPHTHAQTTVPLHVEKKGTLGAIYQQAFSNEN